MTRVRATAFFRRAAVIGALVASPSFAAADAQEALRLAAEGRYAEALPGLEDAVRHDPRNAALHQSLGLAYQALKRYPDAGRSMEQAAKLAPENPEPHYSLGLLYEAMALPSGEKAAGPQKKFLQKARKAWERFLNLEQDPKRLDAAKGHLEKIAELLE